MATATVLAGMAWFAMGAAAAHAHRFGPPWQSRVVAEQTTLYSQPDRGSLPVGPLVRGQVVVVVNEVAGSDGAMTWAQVPDGFLPSSDILEDTTPWLAEVSVPSVSIYARPNRSEPIRRTAKQSDLLRVTGVSPGIEGDTALWWATTEGYVGFYTLATATSEWAKTWTLPQAAESAGGWWGGIRSQANVRAAPSTRASIVGGLVAGDRVKVLAELQGDAVGGNSTWYRIDGGRYAGAVVHSSLVVRLADPKPVVAQRPASASPQLMPGVGRIVISRSAATLTYLDEHDEPQFTTYVSLGRAGVETPDGEYETLGKYRFDTMSSNTVANAEHAYHLPNVPFVQYYLDGGYAIHSTYWHDHFGQVESQGCINLTWSDGAYLFNLTRPRVPDNEPAKWAINVPATPVLILN